MPMRISGVLLILFLCTLAAGAEEMVLTVTVLGPDRQAVASGRVDLFPVLLGYPPRRSWGYRFRPIAKKPAPVTTAEIGEDGRAVLSGLRPGAWWVIAGSEAGAPGVAEIRVGGWMERAQTLTITLPERASLFGRVVRVFDAAPLPGVEVAATLRGTRRRPSHPVHHHFGRSDPSGLYRFEGLAPGVYKLWTRRGGTGWRSADAVHVPAVDRYDLRLLDGARIHGVVTDAATGKPIPGAAVRLMRDAFSLPPGAGALAGTKTDAKGRYEILTRREFVNAGGMEVARDGYRTVRIEETGFWNLPAGMVIKKDFALVAGEPDPVPEVEEDAPPEAGGPVATVMGVVKDLRGKPIPLAEIRSGLEGVLSGRDGSFRLQAPVKSGRVWLEARKTGFDVVSLNLTEKDAEAPGGVEFVLPRAPVLRGKVTSDVGRSVAGGRFFVAWLWCDRQGYPHSDWKSVPGARLGEDGTFEVFLPTLGRIEAEWGGALGWHKIFFAVGAIAPGHGPRISELFALKEGRDEYRMDLKLPAEEVLTGRVVAHATGEPIENAPIWLDPGGGRLGWDEWPPIYPPAEEAVVAVTGPDGGFRIRGLGSLGYTVSTAAPGLSEEWAEVELPRKAPIEFRLQTLSFFAGLVRTPGGTPLAGARVWLEDEEGEEWFGPGEAGGPTTDGKGRFRLEFLPVGTYFVHVHDPDPASVLAPLRHGPVKTGAENLDLTLAVGREITGRLFDADGKPLVGITVQILLEVGAGPCGYAITDREGRFEVRRLAAGPHLVTFAEPGVTLHGIAPGAMINHQLVGGESIKGVIVLPEGVGVDRVKLRAEPISGAPLAGVSREHVAYGFCEDDVRIEFEFRFLPPGEYRITGTAQGFGREIYRVPDGVRIWAGDREAKVPLEAAD